jgi:hypothetical protein
MMYSRRYLTKSSDKLDAFSGIASQFAKANGHTYFAGLWKESVLDDLTWKPEIADYKYWRAILQKLPNPTFSWASVSGSVHYPCLDTSRYGEADTHLVNLVDIKFTHASQNPFGSVKHCSVSLRGPLISGLVSCRGTSVEKLARYEIAPDIPFFPRESGQSTELPDSLQIREADGTVLRVHFEPDIPLAIFQPSPTEAVQLQRADLGNSDRFMGVKVSILLLRQRPERMIPVGVDGANLITIFGLVLTPSLTVPHAFERLGLIEFASVDGHRLNMAKHTADVTLV